MRKNDPEGDAKKVAVLTGALPWLKEFHGNIVVIKYGGHADGRRRVPAGVRRGHGLPADLRHPARRRARRRPADLVDADPAGHPERVPRAACGSPPSSRSTSSGWCSSGQVGPEVVGLINEHGGRAVGLSGEDGGLMTAARTQAIVDGEPVDIGFVGEVVAVDPTPVTRCWRPATSRSSPASPPTRPAAAQPQRRHRRRGAGRRAGAVKLVVLTDVEGLYADWPTATRWSSRSTPASSPRSCRRSTPGWFRRWPPACGRSRGA
jgi:acetylglutamate kinase